MRNLMEQRHNPRFPVHVEVRYSIIGDDSKTLTGYACDVSENGLRLVTEIALTPGAFLKIQMEDSTLFAEVKYCNVWMDLHIAGVYVEEVLLGTSELAKLICATMNQVPKMTPAIATQL